MDSLWTDLRYPVRTLRQNPAFALAAVAMLALGIDVNAASTSVNPIFIDLRQSDRTVV